MWDKPAVYTRCIRYCLHITIRHIHTYVQSHTPMHTHVHALHGQTQTYIRTYTQCYTSSTIRTSVVVFQWVWYRTSVIQWRTSLTVRQDIHRTQGCLRVEVTMTTTTDRPGRAVLLRQQATKKIRKGLTFIMHLTFIIKTPLSLMLTDITDDI